jgi:mono/diheme cytochrome c family protein
VRFPFPALVVPCALAACSHASAPDGAEAGAPASQAVDDLGVLREAAREVLDRNCGECHTSTLPTAVPRALRVYDLAELDWSHHMTDEQLHDAESRLHDPIAPTLGEGEARPVRASAEELAMFHRYVELEVQRRTSHR